MAIRIKIGGTQIFKLDSKDKKRLRTKFNFVVKQNKRVVGFSGLAGVNRAIGSRLTLAAFKTRKRKVKRRRK